MKKGSRYYVQEVAEILGVSTRTLKNWENAGKIPKAKRDPMSGYRVYSDADVNKLKKITERGMSQ